jgi:hypothetical protein
LRGIFSGYKGFRGHVFRLDNASSVFRKESATNKKFIFQRHEMPST